LVWNQDNVSKLSDISICELLLSY